MIVNNPDGTVSIQSDTLTYVLDVQRKFNVVTSCNNSNATYAGVKQNGVTAYKGSVVEVDIGITPASSTLTVLPPRGVFQIWRSVDLAFTWDPSKLELIEAVPSSSTDRGVVDVSKISVSRIKDGVAVMHSQALPPPELRNPKAPAQPFQWNLGGYVWANGMRNMGKLRFRVVSDFYYPSPQVTDIKVVAEMSVDGNLVKSRIDGGAVAGTDVMGAIQNNANQISFGPPPEYKMNLALAGPGLPVAVGDTVGVKVLVTPATLPQMFSSVTTMFAWDNTKLEFMGIDKTGAKAATSSAIDWTGANRVNETSIPKDGTASHNFLNQLGNKTPIDKETLIVTLKFKAISAFAETKVEIINRNDPRVAGLSILDDTGVLGSCVAGTNSTGTVTGATIKGVQ